VRTLLQTLVAVGWWRARRWLLDLTSSMLAFAVVVVAVLDLACAILLALHFDSFPLSVMRERKGIE